MKTKKILHVLRNPYGKSTDQIRAARYAACDLIEKHDNDLRKIVEAQRMDTCSADEYCDSCADMRSFLDRVEKLLEGE